MARSQTRSRLASLLLAAIPLSAGCTSNAIQRQRLGSDYPLDRVRAAVALAEAGDADAVHRLVELLEDDDRGVRLYAILALERLTGRTYGYVYYATQAERDAAVGRWRAALRNGEVAVGGRSRAATSRPARVTSGSPSTPGSARQDGSKA